MLFISIICIIIAIALPNVKISPLLFTRITSIILIYSGVLSVNSLYTQSIGSGISIYSGLFQVTFLSQSIETFIYLMGAIILIPWAFNVNILSNNNNVLSSSMSTNNNVAVEEKILISKFINPRVSEYSLIILFTTLGASLLVSSSDLISMYLSIELQSFAVYILATLYRESEAATSAGLKYFLLGGLSSCLILLGSGLIYSFTGLTNFDSIYSLISIINNESIIGGGINNIGQGIYLGIVVLIAGFLFKIAAAPFHNWAPDVYDDVPTIVTTWLTVMPKISIIIFLLEIQSGTGLNIESISLPLFSSNSNILFELSGQNVLKNLLLLSSLLSLIIGTVVGLAQSRIKRLLAYSTISHVGFLLLALAVNTEQSIESLIFYLIQYSITNANTFLLLLAFGYIIYSSYSYNTPEIIDNKEEILYPSITKVLKKEVDIKYITELKGQFYSNPLLSISLAICLFSMAGIPPLIGFFAKQQVLYSASHSGYYFISLVAILVSVISASYYLKIIKIMHFESKKEPKSIISSNNETVSRKEGKNIELSNSHSLLISIFTLTILFFILKPSILLNSTHLMALSIFIN